MLEEKELINLKFKFSEHDEEMLKIELVRIFEDMGTLGQLAEILKKELQKRYFKSLEDNKL